MLKAEIIGTIGSDAEIKDFSGKKYVSLSVACNDYAKDQQGNRTETTTWVSVLWYGDGGGLLSYLKKGRKYLSVATSKRKPTPTSRAQRKPQSISMPLRFSFAGSRATATPPRPPKQQHGKAHLTMAYPSN